MAHNALDTYLNDHRLGANMGVDLAAQIRDQAEGTPLADVMARVHADIAEDHETLRALVQALDVSRNPVKEATGWLAEKGSRLKFTGLSSGDGDHGLFMALETLSLGILGKAKLWQALIEVRDSEEALMTADLHGLLARAETQHASVEHERLEVAQRALRDQAATAS